MSFQEALELVAAGQDPTTPERYEFGTSGQVLRRVALRNGDHVEAQRAVARGRRHGRDAYAEYWRSWLVDRQRPNPAGELVTIADLFSGCGGLSIGVEEASRAVGKVAKTLLAVDTNNAAMDVFESNFQPARSHRGAIEELVDGELGAPLTPREHTLREELSGLTLAIGGPPCQGHSDLNNHTRRQDPKNALYLRMARFVEVVRPSHVIIENVPGVVHDKTGVVERAQQRLTEIGYHVSLGVLSTDLLGWAQRRRRHVLLASLIHRDLDHVSISARYGRAPLPVMWALDESPTSGSLLDTAATHSSANRARIRFLFDNGLYELPNEQRPDCHRLKPHTYRSVYGRMRPDEPAPTITSGFGSTGQGRFVHPCLPRTLTPREAARVQGIPDWFDFSTATGRSALQEMIGNAVPSRLSYVASLELLR